MTDDSHHAESPSLTRSADLALLASRRRRTLLELLANAPGDTHSVESLATAVAQTEQPADLGARPTHRVCLFLRHVHLPKLDAEGIVDYDATRNVVEGTARQRARQLLEQSGG